MAHSEKRLPETGDLVAGRYRITSEIGRGGYGVVFRAHQEAIARDVAIKFLLPDVADNPKEIERFRREIFHASSLQNRHTITLYDYGQSPSGLFYVVMEFLDGESLYDRIYGKGPVDPVMARRLLEQILESLDEAHRRELVHRDLKPDNIFLVEGPSGDLECRVLDFGLSKFVGDPRSTLYRGPSLTAEGEVCGTPQYMSPEHAYGENVGPAGDIYSLGLVMYEAVVGELAFDAPAALDVLLMQVKEPLPPLPTELANTAIGTFINRATEKEVNRRFPDAGRALEWLYRQPVSDEDAPVEENRSAPVLTASDSGPSRAGGVATTTLIDEPPKILPVEEIEKGGPGLDEPSTLTQRQAALERFELRVAQTPLVGRRRSLALLDSWLERSSARGGVFALTGDAGRGKTALLHHWYTRLDTDHRFRVLRGAHPRNGAPLAGLRDLFSDLLFAERPSTRAPLDGSTAEKLRRLFESSRRGDITTDRSISDLVYALVDALDQLNTRQPLVLIFEDFQNADPATQRFFDHLVDSMADGDRNLAVVVSARQPHHLESWFRGHQEIITHWQLPELEPRFMEELLERLLPTTDDLSAGIFRLSAGNPALLLHICRYLLESELIDFDESRKAWTMTDPSMSIEKFVPLDLQRLIIERADRYLRDSSDEPALRAILHRAVLLGDVFDDELLEQALDAEGLKDLARSSSSLLARLVSSGLLEDRQEGGRHYYYFARPLHRASLVRMVESIDDWRGFHLKVSELLIDRDTLEAARIAEHLQRAGEKNRALPWWLRAARQAEAQHRFQDALLMTNRALRLQREQEADDLQIARVRLQQGRLSRHLGELGPAEDSLRQALVFSDRAEDTGLRARAGELLAEVLLLQGRLDEAAEILDKIDGFYEVLGDHRGRDRVASRRGELATFRGEYGQARKIYHKLLASSDTSSGTSRIEARALLGLTRCFYAAGELRKARDTAAEARHRAQVLGDPSVEASALVENAHIALLTEGIEAAESLAHQALNTARRAQDVLSQANAHLALGICLRRSTNIDRARFHSLRARELHESLGHLYGIIKDILLSAEIAWIQGEPERALILAEDTSQLHEELGDRHGWALSALFRAFFLVELGRPEEARQLLQEVLDIKRREELGLYEPQIHFYLGLAFELESDLHTAIEHFQRATSLAEKIDHREQLSLASINLAKLHLLTGDLESARREIPVALREAEQLGHANANMFALLGCALLARLDGDTARLREYMTRLQTYVATPNAPKIRLPQRLRWLHSALKNATDHGYRADLLEATRDLAESLERSERD